VASPPQVTLKVIPSPEECAPPEVAATVEPVEPPAVAPVVAVAERGTELALM
jgi:hypothetical protein